MLTDSRGRGVSYLRLSVTDRCNLACLYCGSTPAGFVPHAEILRYEELLTLIGIAREIGIAKVRLTGGEPFARRDFLPFVARVHQAHPDLDLRITTNATLIGGLAPLIRQAGVSRLNVSLDSLDRANYERITGKDELSAVRRAVEECLAAGLALKINAVAMRGINDAELAAFLALARSAPLDVRFIEFMPMGRDTAFRAERFWPAPDILAEAQRHADLIPEPPGGPDAGPAKLFRIAGGLGRFGVISPLSDHFCATCNRLRITARGNLRTCLFSDREYRLKPLLRHPRLSTAAVRRVIELALKRKPVGHDLLEKRLGEAVCGTRMSAIGG
jgi:cyclic pyranopterin phosphate synthase